MPSLEWTRTHARPANKNAKFFTYCKNCKATLIRVPLRGNGGFSQLQHPIIAISDFGADVIGSRDHCVFPPEQNWEDHRLKKRRKKNA